MEQNARRLWKMWKSSAIILHKKKTTNRDSIDEQLNQLPICPEMDDLPTEKEINLAIQKLNNLAAGVSRIRA